MRLELPRWYDLHAHFRQDELLAPLLKAHFDMGCAGILAMPNTRPPVARIFKKDKGAFWSIEEYQDMIERAGGDKFASVIVPLYLTQDTTPDMIAAGAKAGILKACKYYPPHGTTGAEFGAPFGTFINNGVFAAMEEHGVVLCIHGEEHNLDPVRYFDRSTNAEDIFYRERLPRALEKFPKLKIVAEHVTTKTAVDFVRGAPDTVAATITPQHLLYTVGDLLKGLYYNLYCLPLLKFEEDRAALRAAVTDKNNTKFFAGTDSAPHAKKVTDCGCAAGCYTGGIAPQLYAEAFDLEGAAGQEAFKRFLCTNGRAFYGLPVSDKTFVLEKKPQKLEPLKIGKQEIMPLPLGLGRAELAWRISAPSGR